MSGKFYKEMMDQEIHGYQKNKDLIESKNFKDSYYQKIDSKLSEKLKELKFEHFNDKTNCASRKSSELTLNLIANYQKNLIGGSADLTGSNNTKAKDMNVITSDNFNENYVHYGIREHGMAAVMNGIALHKGLIPYGGTFLVLPIIADLQLGYQLL